MPGDIIQIVDSISASPTVLFDLNNESPCGVAVFSAPPPQLLRVGTQTQQQDGATEASSVYGDRVIDLDLDLFAATQELSAASLQALARLLTDKRGQWLKWQPVGASSPVFFRTKRTDVTQIVDLPASAALRELHLSVPAQPFAYGLPETGTFDVLNDPSGPKVAAVAINLATNPSFETSNGGTVSVPAGGTKPDVQRQGGGGAVLAVGAGHVAYQDTAWSSSGTKSIATDAGNSTSSANGVYLGGSSAPALGVFGFVAGGTYTVSALCRLTAAQTGSLNANARKIAITMTAPSVAGGVNQTSWVVSAAAPNAAGETRLSVTFTLPGDCTSAGVRFINGELGSGSGGGGGIVWWDDLQVEEGSVASDYRDGDSFGWGWTGTPHASTSGLATQFPMTAELPSVKGDVPTPLSLKILNATTTRRPNRPLIGACATPWIPGVPKITQGFSSGSTSGWAHATGVVDSTAVGGTTNTATKTSGTAKKIVTMDLPAVPLGDFRLLLRVKSDVAGTGIANVAAGVPTGSSLAPTLAASEIRNFWQYRDLGVFRLPLSAPMSTPPSITTLGPNGVSVELTFEATVSAIVISFDLLLAVPAGLDDAVLTRILKGGGNALPFSTDLHVDALADIVWTGTPTSFLPTTYAGGMPAVAPSAYNVLTLIKNIDAHDDDRTDVTGVNWLYYPRYLYVRPTAS